MTTWISENVIKEYFDEFLFGFIINDIDKCIKVRANYVVALALLSYTEYLGALISGNIGTNRQSETSFKNALKYFPKEYEQISNSIVVRYFDEKGQPILKTAGKNKGNTKQEKGIYALFRCGLAHEYFIKGLGTVNNNKNGYADPTKIGIELEDISPNDSLYQFSHKRFIFYTNEYFRDFQCAVKKIYKKLLDNFDTDLKLASKSRGDYLKDSELKSALLKGFCKSLNTYSSRVII